MQHCPRVFGDLYLLGGCVSFVCSQCSGSQQLCSIELCGDLSSVWNIQYVHSWLFRCMLSHVWLGCCNMQVVSPHVAASLHIVHMLYCMLHSLRQEYSIKKKKFVFRAMLTVDSVPTPGQPVGDDSFGIFDLGHASFPVSTSLWLS